MNPLVGLLCCFLCSVLPAALAAFTLTPDNIAHAFRRYNTSTADGCAVHRPTWILNGADNSARHGSFHRFFDSSPFSPSGRFLAFLRTDGEGMTVTSGMRAYVMVLDLLTGEEDKVAHTTAWDSQLGAQVQWGRTDDLLLFNDVVSAEREPHAWLFKIAGVELRRSSGARRVLPCSVYHVSDDGTLAVTPKLSQMHLTQLGYGAYLPFDQPRVAPPGEDDGVHVMELASGRCRRLVSSEELARYIGLPQSTPLYIFHTKLTTDKRFVMVVARTMVKKKSWTRSIWRSGELESMFKRHSHVLVVNSTDGEILSYVLSFGGVKGRSQPGQQPGKKVSIDGIKFHSYHANHPNWITGTHDININIGFSPASRQHQLSFDIARVSFGRGGCSPRQLNRCPEVQINVTGRYLGSGHHIYLPGGRFVVVDAYMKEHSLFPSSGTQCSNHRRVSVPLRLIDLKNQRNTVLCEVPVYWPENNNAGSGRDAWRCDLHPALSRDSRWVVVNGRPDGGYRQLMVIYLGDLHTS